MHRFIKPSLIAGGAAFGPALAIYAQSSERYEESAARHNIRQDDYKQRFASSPSFVSSALVHCDEGVTNKSRNASSATTLAALSKRATPANKNNKAHDGEEKLLLIAGSAHQLLSKEIAESLEVPIAEASISRFADGEVDIRVDSEIRGKDVYFVQSCGAPVSDNIVEILLMVSAARRSGAKRVTAVIPYFPFKHRRRGTTSSSKYHSRFLSSAAMDFAIMLQEVGVDRVVAVDLQRPGQGQEACFFDNSVPLEVVLTKGLMIKHFAENVKFDANRPIVVVAPNTECLKRAMKFTSGLKKSLDRKDVSLMGFMQLGTGTGTQDDKLQLEPLGEANIADADVIIVDDLIDTGDTVIALSHKFHAAGAKNIYVSASHGIFTKDNMERIDASPITKVVVTNSLPMPEDCSSAKVEQVSLGPLLARVIWTEHFRSNLKNFEE